MPLPGGGYQSNYVESNGTETSVTVPPPSFDAATASPAELRVYGIPTEPAADSPEYPKWKQMIDGPMNWAPAPEALVEVPPVTRREAGSTSPVSGERTTGSPSSATTGSDKHWSGYMDWNGGGCSGICSPIYTHSTGYFIEPHSENTTTGCTEVASYTWAGIGGWHSEESTLAQDGTGQQAPNLASDEAFYEVIHPHEAGGGTIAAHFKATPEHYFIADTEYTGSNKYSFYMYNYATHQPFRTTATGALWGKTTEFIVERPPARNLYNFKSVTFQGFTNGKAFRQYPDEQIDMESGVFVKGQGFEPAALPSNIVNNYEFHDNFHICTKAAENTVEEELEGAGKGGALPRATTEGGSEQTETSVKLSGSVDPEGTYTTYHIEYGTEAENYSAATPENSAGEGSASVPVSATVTGLQAGTTYHYRITANSAEGTAVGVDNTFTTTGHAPPPPPTVTTEGASGITAYTATLKATVNPNSLDTHYDFEYGTTSALFERYAPAPPGNDAGSGSTPVQVGAELTELAPNTMYYYRSVATNSTGTTYGVEKEFKTLPPWAIQSTQNPHGSSEADGFMGVSCWLATACDAVGSNTNSEDEIIGLVERWNGSGWEVQSTPKSTGATEDSLESVACRSVNECEATGYAEVAEGKHVTLAERWNGTAWSIQSTPTQGNTSNLVSVSCSSTSECVASGVDLSSAGKQSTLVELWNGKEWKILTTATLPKEDERSWFESVSCPSSKHCTAVGVVVTTLNGIVPLAESYNGSKWTLQTTPTPENSLEAQLSGVSCSATSACTAVGEYYSSTEKAYRALIERYNGTSWQLQESPSPVGKPAPKESHWSLHAVSCPTSSSCVAIGSYAESASARNLLLGEQWNGTSWEPALPVDRTGTGVVSDEPRAISCSAALTCTLAGVTSKEKSTTETLAERMEP